MASAQKTKASDKQAVSRKLITLLKKRYGTSPPKSDRSVMGELLYAICLENTTYDDAERSLERLDELFHDWNEIRVSSITEVAVAFDDDPHAEHRALRARAALQHVFDDAVVSGKPTEDPFDIDPLKRKTQEQAAKQLVKIRETTPFVRNMVLQHALGSHVVPLDDRMHRAAVWLGFVEPASDPESAADAMKAFVRKADGLQFAHLLRELANDPRAAPAFEDVTEDPEAEFDPTTAVKRLEELFDKPASKSKKTAKKSSAKKTSAKSGSKKGAAKKASSKSGSSKGGSAKKSNGRSKSSGRKKTGSTQS